jgi:hypothetical protein
MKLALTSFEALKQETRDALVRCADHGAATTTTLARMVLCKASKAAAGNPSLQNSKSRIQPRSARRRIELLMTAGILERRVISMGNGAAPVWSVVPNRTHPAMAFAALPHGGLDDALLRSMLAAALVDIGFAVGRDPETIEMYSGAARAPCEYRCVHCGTARLLGSHHCESPSALHQSCQLMPHLGSGPVMADVAFRYRADNSMERCVVWVDDGRPVAGQWAEIAILAELPKDPRVKVILRPKDQSMYSGRSQTWNFHGPRLTEMIKRVTAAGYRATAAGAFAHRATSPN